jgi:hypothetical protein
MHRFSAHGTGGVRTQKAGRYMNGVRKRRAPTAARRSELALAINASLVTAAEEAREARLVKALEEMGYSEERAIGCLCYLEEKTIEAALDFMEGISFVDSERAAVEIEASAPPCPYAYEHLSTQHGENKPLGRP